MNRILLWAPRVLCILFALFLGVFALDVFAYDGSLAEKLLGFLIHLVPTFLVLAILAVAWRREWIGAVLFSVLAVFYFVATHGREHWTAYLSISGALVVMGVLFLLGWFQRRRLSAPRHI